MDEAGKDEGPMGEGRSLMNAGAVCTVCGEMCEDRRITLALPRSATGLAVIRNVPAEVCLGCGETRFSLKTTTRLMAVVRSDSPPSEVAVVPIYDMDRTEPS